MAEHCGIDSGAVPAGEGGDLRPREGVAPGGGNRPVEEGTMATTRREFLRAAGIGTMAAATLAAHAAEGDRTLRVDPTPRHELSPYLYMQFMEPLGTTDSSVAASWDHGRNCWREDLIECTRRLGPTLMRWGGCFASYYRWREAIGPREARVPVQNLLWGGFETNQVGTAEFVDFCRQVGADALMTVNFESDFRPYWSQDGKGRSRVGDAREAAEWVRYCNAPEDEERRAHGFTEPLHIPLWQIGNETSYDAGAIEPEAAARKTVEFAKAMRAEDPTIRLIGWGDIGWTRPMVDIAGEHIDYVAFHHMFSPDDGHDEPILRTQEYRKDFAATWERLMDARDIHEARIRAMCEELEGTDMPLAMTECHFALPGRDRCDVMATWATGVAYARMANVHQRYGDRLKIATMADFCGTRWQVNAIMIPTPGGTSFMMPVALVMSLYRHHTGERALNVGRVPGDLDVVASRTGDTVFLHVVNTNRTRSVKTTLGVDGMKVLSGRVHQLCADPEFEVMEGQSEDIVPVESALPASAAWRFPAASVTAVELKVV